MNYLLDAIALYHSLISFGCSILCAEDVSQTELFEPACCQTDNLTTVYFVRTPPQNPDGLKLSAVPTNKEFD